MKQPKSVARSRDLVGKPHASSTSSSQNTQASGTPESIEPRESFEGIKQKGAVPLARIATAIALLTVTFAVFAWGHWGVLFLLLTLCVVGCDEAARMVKSSVGWRITAVVLGLAWMGWLCLDTVSPDSGHRLRGFILPSLGAIWFWILLEMILSSRPPPSPSESPFSIPLIVPVLYIATGLTALYALWHKGGFGFTCALLATWSHDSLAYVCGSAYGRRPLCPSISKGKTWEGLAAGGLGAVALLMGVWALRHQLPWLASDPIGFSDALMLAIGCVAGAVLGDLVESKFKRLCGVKDSSQLLPGHGGVLDRIDGLIASAMFAWVWLH